jgi:hypothetical protein
MKKLILLLFIVAFSSYANSSCRSSSVKKQFDRINGYSKSREGYIVDHICALACGGLDDVKNMQYQTALESKAKDRWETTTVGCSTTCNSTNSLPRRTVFNCK